MTLNNIKTLKKERGFTIVELLIVIVIIAILAAITIVAYNGIQNRAKLSSAQSAASTIAKKTEAYNAELSSYPTTLAALTGAASSATYNVPTGSVTQATSVPTTAPANANTILFYTCGSGAGVKIGYWDYVTGAAVSTATTYTAGNVGGTCTLATT